MNNEVEDLKQLRIDALEAEIERAEKDRKKLDQEIVTERLRASAAERVQAQQAVVIDAVVKMVSHSTAVTLANKTLQRALIYLRELEEE